MKADKAPYLAKANRSQRREGFRDSEKGRSRGQVEAEQGMSRKQPEDECRDEQEQGREKKAIR